MRWPLPLHERWLQASRIQQGIGYLACNQLYPRTCKSLALADRSEKAVERTDYWARWLELGGDLRKVRENTPLLVAIWTGCLCASPWIIQWINVTFLWKLLSSTASSWMSFACLWPWIVSLLVNQQGNHACSKETKRTDTLKRHESKVSFIKIKQVWVAIYKLMDFRLSIESCPSSEVKYTNSSKASFLNWLQITPWTSIRLCTLDTAGGHADYSATS